MTASASISALLEAIDARLATIDLQGVRDVRTGLARWRDGPQQDVIPRTLPPCTLLPEALAAMPDRALASAIAAALPHLRWNTYDAYPRAEIGDAFAIGHAFTSLVGEDSHRAAEDFDFGLFLIAPRTLYRDHHHKAPELYLPFTGPHGWRFLPDMSFHEKPAGVPVWNESWAPHATLTGAVPFLCLFAWTRDVNDPARVIPVDEGRA